MDQLQYMITIHNNTRTPHTVCWSMLSKARAATHLYHVCACGFDTSNRYINTFINTCAFMYQGSGGDSHQWAALVLPVSIHTHSSLWGGDSDWSCINLYRSVSRNIDTATCIEYWAHEGTKHASRYLTDTWPQPTRYIAIQDVGTPQIQRMYFR